MYKKWLCCVLIALTLLSSACGSRLINSIEQKEYQIKGHAEKPFASLNPHYNQDNELESTCKSDNLHVEPQLAQLLLPASHKTIAAGTYHSLVIVDGNLWAWGYNWHGQLGDGTNESRDTPVQIGTHISWASVDISWSHTVALATDGSLWAWGYNGFGIIGDGTTENRAYPVQVGSARWSYVATGEDHIMAIKTDGTLWGWGLNRDGQVSNTALEEHGELVLEPTQIGTNTDWVRVMPKSVYTIALRADGSLWFWGHGLWNSVYHQTYGTPIQIGMYEDWIRMSTQDEQISNVEIREDGSLWAWGGNWFGQLGDGTTIDRDYPIQIGTDTDWVNITMGDRRTVAIKADGSVWSWGWFGEINHNVYGIYAISLIGDGGNESRSYPVKIIAER